MSTFGTIFRVTTFGESHCAGVGCIVDGVPPQVNIYIHIVSYRIVFASDFTVIFFFSLFFYFETQIITFFFLLLDATY